MVSGTPIISIGAEGESPAAAPQGDSQGWSGAGPMPRLDELGYRETDETPADFAEIGGATDWVLPALAGLAVAGWSALFLWAQRDAIAQGPTPAEWMAWLGQWSGPVLVIGLAWLLAMRNSRREGRRFADTARMLATEAAALDARLVAANRELSLAREFMAAQARDLDALGRTAADRLHQQAERLTALVGQNAAEVSALGAISETALQNMEALRAQLPVVANATRDVTNHIGAAG
ncbi:MAG TPA: ATPase, partial [Novosphingobium sp.]|nr:ATPase [Novosphingobium sp.]